MIRQVELQDAKAITNIYNEYVLHSVATFDTEPVQEEEMRARIAEISSRFPYFVYEEDKEITGYCYAHTWKERSAYRYTLETTVYLSPGHTGKGIGMLLMQRLIEACRENGYRALIACITEGNEASNILHERLGFKQVSHFTKLVSGDCAVTVEFGNEISPEINRKITATVQLMKEQHIEGVVDMIPAFCSLLVNYDPRVISYDDLKKRLEILLKMEVTAGEGCRKVYEIPVCYGGEYGPDIENIAEHAGLSVEEVIKIHCKVLLRFLFLRKAFLEDLCLTMYL